MKMTKKILTALLAVLMLSTLACTAWADDVASFDDIKSLRMDIDLIINMDMSLFGESLTDIKMDMDGTLDMTRDPERFYLDMTTTGDEESQHLLSYYEPQGTGYVVYTSVDEGKTWEKQTVTDEAIPNGIVSSLDSFAKIAEFAKGFEKTGTEEIHGRKADVYSGVLSNEQLKEYLEISGSLDALFTSFGTNTNDMDASTLGEMPVTIMLDSENGMLLGYSMDMKDFLQNLMQAVMESLMAASLEGQELPEDFDLSMLEIAVTIKEAQSYTTLYDFNAVEEITMPNAA
jgi:hypothetical protein